MAHRSGAARKRRRKFEAIMAEKDADHMRGVRGGDVIDRALCALDGLSAIIGPNPNLHLVNGGDLALLLDFIAEDIRLGREVQAGQVPQDAI